MNKLAAIKCQLTPPTIMIFNGVKKAVMEDDHVKHCYVLLYNTVVFNIVIVFVLGYIGCICECIRVNVRLTPRTPRMHARRAHRARRARHARHACTHTASPPILHDCPPCVIPVVSLS